MSQHFESFEDEGNDESIKSCLTDQVDAKKVKKKISLDLAIWRLFLTFIPVVLLNW